MWNHNHTKRLTSNLPPPPIPSKCKKQSHQPYYLNNAIKQTSINKNTPTDQVADDEQPIPDTSYTKIKNLRIQINFNNIPNGLPNTPSTFHTNNTQLSTVSADSEIKINDKINHTLDPPNPILKYNSLSNKSSTSPVSNNTNYSLYSDDDKNRKHIYIQHINGSFPDTDLPRPLSPINRQQKQRNEWYEQRHLIMKCATNCNTATSHNSSNNGNNKNANGNGNNNNDTMGNDWNNNQDESSSLNGAGSGGDKGGDDDRKKDKDNDKILDEDDSEEEKEKKQDEDDSEDSEEEEQDEHCMLYGSKSEPVSRKSTLNGDADVFIPDRSNRSKVSILSSIDENYVLLSDCKSLPVDTKQYKSFNVNDWEGRYTPDGLHRARGCIQLSKKLTQNIIPNMIREKIKNVYEFIDKCTSICLYSKNYFDNGKLTIFNYGFHDKLGNDLYCVADRINVEQNRKSKYKMREKLFTKNEIFNVFSLTVNDLPISACDLNTKVINDEMDKIKNVLSNPAMFCEQIIFKTKWHKIHIYNGNINKKQINKFNRERLTFSITKTQFIKIIAKFIYNQSLIPIVMFNNNGYGIEYVQIVELRDDIHIGISYIYHNKIGIKVMGIHLKKNNILNQHQLISPNHNCHCLDSFVSNIDYLHIGNPDDDKNRYKAAKKDVDRLKMENEELKQQISQLKNGGEKLTCENKELRNENIELKNTMSKTQNNNSNNNTIPSMTSYNTSSSYTLKTNLLASTTTSNSSIMPQYNNVASNNLLQWGHTGFVMIQTPTPVGTVLPMQNNYSNVSIQSSYNNVPQ